MNEVVVINIMFVVSFCDFAGAAVRLDFANVFLSMDIMGE